jgi:O-antigen ligase
VLLLVYLFLAFLYRRTAFALTVSSRSLVMLWLILLLSYFWSVVPRTTAGVILSQSVFLFFALCISARYQSTGFAGSLRGAAMTLLCLVGLYCIAHPKETMSALSGAGLNAFYIHKNAMGAIMGLCALALFYAPERKVLHTAFGLVATGFLVATLSKTSIALFVVCSVLLPLATWWANKYYQLPQKRSMTGIVSSALYAIVLLGLLAMVVFSDQLVDLFWNNLTKTALTGRGQLWLTVLQQIRAHSLLGIGPGTLWQAEGASEIAHTMLYLKDPYWVRNMVSSDGGYIDLVASIGVLGLALFLLTAVDLYRRLFRNWHQPDSRLIFILTTFVLLQAVTESTILYSTNIEWLIYLLCYFRVAGYFNSHPTTQQKR